jgi:nitrile hydratase accessory protein
MSEKTILAALLDASRDEDAPVFAEPWQAEAFATTVALSRGGAFTWKEWTETFGAEIKRHPQAPDEDAGAAYYRQWLAALEALLYKRALTNPSDVADTAEHWRRSYLNTAHGSPVAFSRNWRAPQGDDPSSGEHDHRHGHEDHDQVPRPVAISAATNPLPPRR